LQIEREPRAVLTSGRSRTAVRARAQHKATSMTPEAKARQQVGERLALAVLEAST
jgi:hypothetical protein